MSGKTTGIVRFTLNPQQPPTLSNQAKARLDALRDEDIDYSDIPPQGGVQWTRPGALTPMANKQQVTLRLDAEVLAFFKNTGRRYQTRINAVLKAYVQAHQKELYTDRTQQHSAEKPET
jgi:uncharacterized protein (DUF4415 family)